MSKTNSRFPTSGWEPIRFGSHQRHQQVEFKTLAHIVESTLPASDPKIVCVDINGDRSVQLFPVEFTPLIGLKEYDPSWCRPGRAWTLPERKPASDAYLEEAITLANRRAWESLAWLHTSGPLAPDDLLARLSHSRDGFEAVSRLFLLGLISYDSGTLSITPLGVKALDELGLLQPTS